VGNNKLILQGFGWDHKKYSLNMGHCYCTAELYWCLVSYNCILF